jgi:hypothetical protein
LLAVAPWKPHATPHNLTISAVRSGAGSTDWPVSLLERDTGGFNAPPLINGIAGSSWPWHNVAVSYSLNGASTRRRFFVATAVDAPAVYDAANADVDAYLLTHQA